MSHKTKVIHSTPVWLPQTQTWMYTQVKHLPESIEAHIVCEQTEHLEQFKVPNIHCLSNYPKWRYIWYKGIRKLRQQYHLGFLTWVAKKVNAQILHSHFGNNAWVDMRNAKLLGIKHTVTFYGFDVVCLPQQSPIWRKRYQELFKQVDYVLCEGGIMKQAIVGLGCPENKVRVHHLGIPIDKIPFKPRIWQSGEALRILIAASFQEKKGIPYALEALTQLSKEMSIEITIIGDATSELKSQKEKDRILWAVNKLKIKAKVRLLGYRSHDFLMNESYNNHVFISPSITASDGDTEGGAPITIIEMLASGMPVISTNHADIPEVLKEGYPLSQSRERNTEDLLMNLRWLIQEKDTWAKGLLKARKYLEKEYSAERQGKKLAQIYKDLIL